MKIEMKVGKKYKTESGREAEIVYSKSTGFEKLFIGVVSDFAYPVTWSGQGYVKNLSRLYSGLDLAFEHKE